jgi:hypothetical protein
MNRLTEASKADPARARVALATALCMAALFAAPGLAHAKPARCFTTDDGQFSCDFRIVDRDGSFTISAAGKPTYTLNMSEPGVAYGFTQIESKSIPLPGRYLRDSNDGACWVNDATKAKICAW